VTECWAVLESAIHSDNSSREAFERYWLRSRSERKHRDRLQGRRDDGSYADTSVQRHWWTWQSAMRSTGAPPQVHRAFAIADEAMYELLLSEGVAIDGRPSDATAIGFTTEACQEVNKLTDASPAMCDAFDWLARRGYVELGTDKDGEFVQVVRRPGEDF